jgi:hypothetical protein
MFLIMIVVTLSFQVVGSLSCKECRKEVARGLVAGRTSSHSGSSTSVASFGKTLTVQVPGARNALAGEASDLVWSRLLPLAPLRSEANQSVSSHSGGGT